MNSKEGYQKQTKGKLQYNKIEKFTGKKTINNMWITFFFENIFYLFKFEQHHWLKQQKYFSIYFRH